MGSFRLQGYLLIVLTILVITLGTTPVQAGLTVDFEKEMHFLTPSGDDVLVEAGTYEVEAAEEGLRLVPQEGERSEAVLLAASRSPHMREVSTPEVRSIRAGEDEEYLWLLLPDGQSWAAKGSYSGMRTRDLSGDARLHYGYEYRAPRIATYNKVEHSLGFCLMLVEKGEGGAKAFTWDSQTKSCRTFGNVDNKNLLANPRYVSGTRTARFFPKEYKPIYPGALVSTWAQAKVIWPEFNKWSGWGTYKTNPNVSLQTCQVSCAKDSDCTAFAWGKTIKKCFLRNKEHATSTHSGFITGGKISYMEGISRMAEELERHHTAINLPKCIQAAQRGPKKWVSPIFGQGWNCAPFRMFPVDDPRFKKQVLGELFPAALEQAMRRQFASAAMIQDAKDDFFNKFSGKLKLASAPANTHVLIGYVSHTRRGTNDVAYYSLAVSRISADETVVHGASIDYRAGGVFGTPILGTLLEVAISQAVSYLTGGIPFTGTLAVAAVKKIANQGSGGTEANANNIVGAIALSAGSLLPVPTTQVTAPVTKPQSVNPVIQPKVTRPPTKLPLKRSFSLGGIRSRGLGNLPPLVIPDPEPPALPNTELPGVTP